MNDIVLDFDQYMNVDIKSFEYLPEIRRYGPFKGTLKIDQVLDCINRDINVEIDEKFLNPLLLLVKKFNYETTAWNKVCPIEKRRPLADKAEEVILKMMGLFVESEIDKDPLYIPPTMSKKNKPITVSLSQRHMMEQSIKQQRELIPNSKLHKLIEDSLGLVQEMKRVPDVIIEAEEEFHRDRHQGTFDDIVFSDSID